MFDRRIDMLNDAIAYYWGKPERRCTNDFGMCFYTSNKDTTEGCAIGRHLPLELSKELDLFVNDNSGVSNREVFNKLPAWMQHLGQHFLVALQELHDSCYLRDKNKVFVKDIMEGFVDINEIIFPDNQES